MSRLLVMLSPPRSFSSVVSTMLGEHPQLYGFPELHIFTGDTLGLVMDIDAQKNKGRHTVGPAGLVRALAELNEGQQTNATGLRAIAWMQERRDWPVTQVLDHLLAKVAPRIGIEKSPITALKPEYLERAYACYPGAFFLHLTRHPVSNRASWHEFIAYHEDSPQAASRSAHADRFLGWYQMHSNILQFTRSLPLGQSLRVKGEDILSEPDVYLPQICEWLGIRTDREAVEAMKHPERSPYARIGPDVARGGNDHKFMRSPALRPGRVREPSLLDTVATERPDWLPDGRFKKAAQRAGLRVAPHERIAGKLAELANRLGYL